MKTKQVSTPTLQPGSLLRMSQLATRPEVTSEQAKRNRARGKYPNRPRPARAGIFPVTSMTISRWVRAGKFPKPILVGETKLWTADSVAPLLGSAK